MGRRSTWSASPIETGMGRNGRGAFSFVEILIGIVILLVGLVPLMVAYTVSTRETRISISQVQAINHAANLLEALRAYGSADFKNLMSFPRAMEQRKGGDNQWVAMTSGMVGADDEPSGTSGQPGPTPAGGPTDASDPSRPGEGSFSEFKKIFFSPEKPIVPKIEAQFRRCFQILAHQAGYLTIIVKVVWEDVDPGATKGAQERVIELRTVIADPYLFITHGALAVDGEPGASPSPGSGPAPSASPPLPPIPRAPRPSWLPIR